VVKACKVGLHSEHDPTQRLTKDSLGVDRVRLLVAFGVATHSLRMCLG
jgi:hypothetical protein